MILCSYILRIKRVKFKTYENGIQINFNTDLNELNTNKTVIDQILINLISNAIKYSDKPIVAIEIGISEQNNSYAFYIKDNGPGIAPEYHTRIFELFQVLSAKDKYGKSGHGIGLATVKKIVERSGGNISVSSILGTSTTFQFTISK